MEIPNGLNRRAYRMITQSTHNPLVLILRVLNSRMYKSVTLLRYFFLLYGLHGFKSSQECANDFTIGLKLVDVFQISHDTTYLFINYLQQGFNYLLPKSIVVNFLRGLTPFLVTVSAKALILQRSSGVNLRTYPQRLCIASIKCKGNLSPIFKTHFVLPIAQFTRTKHSQPSNQA